MNEDLADLHPLTRLLFQAMWCVADKNGRLEDRPRRIKATCLPFDDHDVEAALADLEAAGFIVRYEADSQSIIEVRNFGKHQRPHPKEEEKYPANPHGYAEPNLSAAKPLQVPAKPDPRAHESGELKSKSGKRLEEAPQAARANLAGLLDDLEMIWPDGRSLDRQRPMRDSALFDAHRAGDLPDDLAESARLYVESHGFADGNFDGCLHLHNWITQRAWNDPLPVKPGRSRPAAVDTTPLTDDELREYESIMAGGEAS